MAKQELSVSRRRILLGAGALGGAAVLAGCTDNSPSEASATPASAAAGADPGQAGKPITIGFSAPEADHGWIGPITTNAKSQAKKYSEVTLEAVEGTNDVNQQISQVDTLISKGVDVIVL